MDAVKSFTIKGILLLFVALILGLEVGCASNLSTDRTEFVPYTATGMVDFYGYKNDGFDGTRMANGKIFHSSDPYIAASQILPIGTKLKVTDLENNNVIYVRVADKIGTNEDNILSLSYAAGKALGMKKVIATKVRIDSITEDEYRIHVPIKTEEAVDEKHDVYYEGYNQ